MTTPHDEPAVSPEMKATIRARLLELEAQASVRILFATESGSRAWGFPSPDSDYDVRFIYVRRPEAYLTIGLHAERDVIEQPLSEELDLSGWDIRKALRLFAKSNPPLLEWLQMDWTYLEAHSMASRLRAILPASYSPRACFHHYLSMGKSHRAQHLQGELVKPKKYFYVLRSIMALRWLERGFGPVPIQFGRLLEAAFGPAATAVFKKTEHVHIVACGTSWHSALLGEYLLEELAHIPVEVEYASEFRYRDPVVDAHTLVVAISQSGESTDTNLVLQRGKDEGALTIGITNDESAGNALLGAFPAEETRGQDAKPYTVAAAVFDATTFPAMAAATGDTVDVATTQRFAGDIVQTSDASAALYTQNGFVEPHGFDGLRERAKRRLQLHLQRERVLLRLVELHHEPTVLRSWDGFDVPREHLVAADSRDFARAAQDLQRRHTQEIGGGARIDKHTMLHPKPLRPFLLKSPDLL